MSYYLIDFENVGSTGFNGIEKLNENDEVIVFYSRNAIRTALDIFGTDGNAKIRFIKAECGTQNALDFQLSSCIGSLAKEIRGGDEIWIISKDKGYSPLVPFWKRYGITVKTAVDLAGNTVPVKPVVVEKVVQEEKKEEEAVSIEDLLNEIEEEETEEEKQRKKEAEKELKKQEELKQIKEMTKPFLSKKEKKKANLFALTIYNNKDDVKNLKKQLMAFFEYEDCTDKQKKTVENKVKMLINFLQKSKVIKKEK